MPINTYGPGADYSALWAAQAQENNRKWGGLNQPAPAQQPIHRIAPPRMSANAQKVLAQAMGMPSRNWGEALSNLGNTWAAAHAGKRESEQKRQYLDEQEQRRGVWAQQLHSGASLRDIATHDPGVLGDTAFLDFAAKTKPEAAAEFFEDVDSPYGRGGFGQRSSTTGKISGYQSPLATPKEPERRTAKDHRGRLRYLDTGEAAFSDDILGPDPAPANPEGPPLKDRLQMVRQLSDDWRKTIVPVQELLDQSHRMDIGFSMAKAGDMLAGSQAILISFNKLLDPTSVVRESEYARSATGQSALETMKGFVDRLSKGGAGVTLAELESYKRFGQQVVQKALESTVEPERARISRLVKFVGVDPELIFTGRFASDASPQGAPQAPQGGVATAPMAQAAPAQSSLLSEAQAAPVAGQVAADPERVKGYAQLLPPALKRQAATMKANPAKYTDAERRAMALAWRSKFGE